jgi:hypothetical protein
MDHNIMLYLGKDPKIQVEAVTARLDGVSRVDKEYIAIGEALIEKLRRDVLCSLLDQGSPTLHTQSSFKPRQRERFNARKRTDPVPL